MPESPQTCDACVCVCVRMSKRPAVKSNNKRYKTSHNNSHMIRLELQAGLGGAGVGVFQEGRLIEDDPRPRGVEEEGLPVRATGDVDLVIGEHAGVGGDDEVDVLETAPKVGAVAVRHIHDDLGVDGVLLELVLPLHTHTTERERVSHRREILPGKASGED